MTRLIPLLLLAVAPLLSSASLLRGRNFGNELPRAQISTFSCYPYMLDGLALPGTTVDPVWTCKDKHAEAGMMKSYTLEGDVESVIIENLGDGMNIPGLVKMTIPMSIVVNDSIDVTKEGIVFSFDHSRRERRHLATKTGNHKLLIVRVIDKNNRSPTHWQPALEKKFYGTGNDSNNICLKSIFKDCSDERLIIGKATNGSNGFRGMINIRVNLDINAAGTNYDTIGTAVENIIYNDHSDIDYTTMAIIYPQGTNFLGGEAWAMVGGNIIYIKDEHAGKPAVLAHEYGHLLGAEHSSKTGHGLYGDNTGFMGGNQIPWNVEGQRMCFNPRKTWQFGWYAYFHMTVKPLNGYFNDNIVGIVDAANNNAGSKKAVLRIQGPDDNKEYFLMYNRKKGFNEDVKAAGNKVVITRQILRDRDHKYSDSMAELDNGQQWTLPNFDGNNNNLVVKNCNNNDIERAHVLIYMDNDFDIPNCDMDPANDSSSSNNNNNSNKNNNNNCQDFVKNDVKWHDSGGSTYDCYWYETTDGACNTFGSMYKNKGLTASQACCACKP